ncbi:hypothetical protein [Lacticaseibacillus zeae]|uniref:hypothetical protein n=1 Tax=Lacticaseibacillus zeae TaxID=57037 RepID=UPI001CDB15BF|nr:hypothetical protein [Lacticaseibacillus zeae]
MTQRSQPRKNNSSQKMLIKPSRMAKRQLMRQRTPMTSTKRLALAKSTSTTPTSQAPL